MNPVVLVAGSLAYDRIFNYPGRFSDAILPNELHVLNVSFTVGNVRESFGGTAGNIAYSLRLLGVPVSIVGEVGSDFAPYKTWLRRHGVGLERIRRIPKDRTAAAYVITDQDDNQIAAFQLGAMSHPSPVGPIPPSVRFGLVSPGNTTTMMNLARACHRAGIPFLFDPGQVIPIFRREALSWLARECSGIIGNDYEMKLISKRLNRKLDAIRSRPEFSITTLGGRGSIVTRKGKHVRIPAARPDSTLDPTGAGDAYRAGFIAGLIRGFDLPTAARMGAVASVYTVERFGTQTHRFTSSTFSRRYRENFDEIIHLD